MVQSDITVSLHFMHYNFCRVHQTLRVKSAMAAGLRDHVWELGELIALMPKAVASRVGEREARLRNGGMIRGMRLVALLAFAGLACNSPSYGKLSARPWRCPSAPCVLRCSLALAEAF